MKYYALSALLALASVCAHAQDRQKKEGGGSFMPAPAECITPAQHDAIQRRLNEQIRVMDSVRSKERKGRKKKATQAKTTATSLIWPLQQVGTKYFNCDAVSNFVDHDTASPGALQDWNCGTRTYDLASGYDHGGTDIFLWPFWWNQMDEQNVKIVAAAPGTIIGKDDGFFDRECAMGGSSWNAVYVRHADGSVAWYGHMKKASLTTKAVGSTVVAGELLGYVGSSGSSTGPHLHFELHDASGTLIDPYTGPCNPGSSWWSPARSYNISQVNALLTHSAEVEFSTCPMPDVTNASDTFERGDQIYYYAYYSDQLTGQVSNFKITRPDGSTDDTWNYTATTNYVAAYRYWSEVIPATAPGGVWQISVTYQGNSYTHKYYIRTTSSVPGGVATQNSFFYPNPVTDWLHLGSVSGASQFVLFDALGHTVLTAAGDAHDMDMSALPSGIYFLKAIGTEAPQVGRVVKQ